MVQASKQQIKNANDPTITEELHTIEIAEGL